MRIFVAGATGVVGRRLVPLLVDAGHDVTAVARTPAKSRMLERQNAQPVTVDLFDAAAVKRAVARHDVVINMATHIPAGGSDIVKPGAFDENNRIRREASRILANAAAEAGAERFIQESFAAVYPDCGDQWIDESVPINPSRYVATVADAENAAADFTKRGGNGVVLRFSFFYGPDSEQTRDMVNAVRKGIAPALGGPNGYMSSLWLDDSATAILAALKVLPGVYTVTDDEPMTRRQAFDALAAELGVKPPKILPAWTTRLLGSVGET